MNTNFDPMVKHAPFDKKTLTETTLTDFCNMCNAVVTKTGFVNVFRTSKKLNGDCKLFDLGEQFTVSENPYENKYRVYVYCKNKTRWRAVMTADVDDLQTMKHLGLLMGDLLNWS